MSREKNLFVNTFVLSLGQFLPKLMSLITLPIITGYLTKAEYGTYDLISTLVMLLIPVATLQIQSAAFRFLIDYRDDESRKASIVSNIFVVIIPVSIIVSIGVMIFMPSVSFTARVLIGVYFFLDTIQATTEQVVRGFGLNKIYSIGAIVRSLINALFIVLTVALLGKGLEGVLVSLIVAFIVSIIYEILKIKLWRYLKISEISGVVIKEMLAYSWPMVPNNLSNWVLKLSDRLVITALLGVEANAVYAVANKIPNILSMAQAVLVMAWHENASQAVKDKDASEYYSKMFNQIFSLVISLTALLICCTPIMFAILIRGDYDEAYYQMPILILGMFFYCMSSFQGGIYVAHKKTMSVGVSTMVAAAINLVIDLALVNIIGITAGSLSTLIAYFVLYVYRQIGVQKFQKVDFHVKKQIAYLAVICLMLLLCFLRMFWVNVANIAIGVAFSYLLNKDLVKSMLLKAKKKIRNHIKK